MKFYSLIVSLSCLLLVGCNNGTKITGTIKFSDGTPVTKGQVVFDNGNNSYFGAISSAGTYVTGGNQTVEGIPNGSYKVWLAGTETADNKTGANGTITSYTVTQTVAKKFTSLNTTDLKFEVKPGGAKTFDITVEKP
ncbi:MAG: hypothetical protein LBT05_03625 [Planctomycetaceae bacterium]|nr:hypothetical protein [Planctomycetaceae bacterium]